MLHPVQCSLVVSVEPSFLPEGCVHSAKELVDVLLDGACTLPQEGLCSVPLCRQLFGELVELGNNPIQLGNQNLQATVIRVMLGHGFVEGVHGLVESVHGLSERLLKAAQFAQQLLLVPLHLGFELLVERPKANLFRLPS